MTEHLRIKFSADIAFMLLAILAEAGSQNLILLDSYTQNEIIR